jgi:hypothetical protein
LPQTGGEGHIAGRIAERPRGRHRKGRRVNPLRGRRAASKNERYSGRTFGRWLFVFPSGTAVAERSTKTLTGKPVCAPTIEVNCQEPKALRKIPG